MFMIVLAPLDAEIRFFSLVLNNLDFRRKVVKVKDRLIVVPLSLFPHSRTLMTHHQHLPTRDTSVTPLELESRYHPLP